MFELMLALARRSRRSILPVMARPVADVDRFGGSSAPVLLFSAPKLYICRLLGKSVEISPAVEIHT